MNPYKRIKLFARCCWNKMSNKNLYKRMDTCFFCLLHTSLFPWCLQLSCAQRNNAFHSTSSHVCVLFVFLTFLLWFIPWTTLLTNAIVLLCSYCTIQLQERVYNEKTEGSIIKWSEKKKTYIDDEKDGNKKYLSLSLSMLFGCSAQSRS